MPVIFSQHSVLVSHAAVPLTQPVAREWSYLMCVSFHLQLSRHLYNTAPTDTIVSLVLVIFTTTAERSQKSWFLTDFSCIVTQPFLRFVSSEVVSYYLFITQSVTSVCEHPVYLVSYNGSVSRIWFCQWENNLKVKDEMR